MAEHTTRQSGPRAAAVLRSAPVAGRPDVAYTEYGPPDGSPVVFLHGTPGSRLLGSLFDADATRLGVRLLAIDRPGYGRSPPWCRRELTDTGEFVAAVLDDAGIPRAGLVGVSGGGPHALAAAATRPERVREVDVVAGAVPPSLRRENPPAVQRALATMAECTPPVLRALFRGQAWVAARTSPSAVVSQYTTGGCGAVPADAAEVVRRDFVEAFAGGAAGAVEEFRLLEQPWTDLLDGIGPPVRCWHGDRDTNVPVADARSLAERLPNGELNTVADADHLRTLLRSRSRVLEEQVGAGAQSNSPVDM
ncbi:alpha/beta fold hydrolase [Halomarina litorea]|uniref:alpha/beta fold hydrolase n=1 Tax=Halomarina litorea TaxID=2961595 RepID=UPI0020C5147B|nr:alpha/beta hydrolase [Halomarina sp. BCD28]